MTWELWEADLLKRLERAYRAVEDTVPHEGKPVGMAPDFQRQLVHVRLDLGLLKPGYDLPAAASFAPCLALNPLDDRAVTALSDWLASPEGSGQWRGFSAATMPSFIGSVLACRSLGADDRGYHEWRNAWFRLDQYADESGRRDRVDAALGPAT
jgi:hypothetical protein